MITNECTHPEDTACKDGCCPECNYYEYQLWTQAHRHCDIPSWDCPDEDDCPHSKILAQSETTTSNEINYFHLIDQFVMKHAPSLLRKQSDGYTVYTIDSHKDMLEITKWLDIFNLQYDVKRVTVSRSEVWVKD